MWRAAVLAMGMAGAGQAQSPEQDMLRALLTGPALADQFAPAFLSAIPLRQLGTILTPLRNQIGAPYDISVAGDRFVISTASYQVTARIELDAEGRVVMLFFEPPVLLQTDLNTALAALVPLADTTAWLVQQDDETLAQRLARRSLPVASAFKLGVLSVLLDDIETGVRGWSDVAILQDRHRSLLTGTLHRFPANSPLTLHSLAAAMIADSDNTATDVLMDVLGRDRIAAALRLPFVLSTREMFSLKADADLAAAFGTATAADRPLVAEKAASGPLPLHDAVSGQFAANIEWQVALTTLCDLLRRTADAPVFSINPGVADSETWDQIAFKGGSQPGVLNLSTLVQLQNVRFCVAVTLNHSGAIENAAAISTYAGVLAALRHRVTKRGEHE